MTIQIVAVGTQMPKWVNTGFEEYHKRFTRNFPIKLTEVPIAKRHKSGDVNNYLKKETADIMRVLPEKAHLVILDEKGKLYNSIQLSKQIEKWQGTAKPISIVIGGADGIDKSLKDRANELWSLSPLTLPHPVVRIVLIEQLYRAWTILQGHPYHRA